jgi:hypothetical protein
MERMMKLARYADKDAKLSARDVLSVETELVKISKSRVERGDPKGFTTKSAEEAFRRRPHRCRGTITLRGSVFRTSKTST